MEFHAYRLPKLKPSYVELANAASLCALPEAVDFGCGKATLQMYRTPPVFKPDSTIVLNVNGEKTDLYLSSSNCVLAHEAFAKPEAAHYTEFDIPPEVRAALLEHLLAPLWTAVSQTLGVPIECEDIVFDAPAANEPMVGIRLNLSVPGRELAPLDLALAPHHDAAARLFAQLISSGPRHSNGTLLEALLGVPVVLSFVGATLALSNEQFQALESGDVLIPETWLPNQNALTLNLISGNRQQLTAPCSLNATQVTMTGPLSQISENIMSDTNDLAINLTFELENRTVTLSELQGIQEGFTFTLTSEPHSPVTIRANGKAIAKGRLVDLNGAVGVQITESLR